MVLLWTALSFNVPSKVPSGVPRRLYSPLAWESSSLHHWSVVKVNYILSIVLNLFLYPGLFYNKPHVGSNNCVIPSGELQDSCVRLCGANIVEGPFNSYFCFKVCNVVIDASLYCF
jgi:hypothetical protein